MRKKRRLKKWEKIFIISNITFIIMAIGFYAYRLIYFYNDEHTVFVAQDLVSVLTHKIVYNGEGLYKVDHDNFYYKGKKINNYLSYAGRLWRIIGIDPDGIKLITESNQTSLVWGTTNNYETSYAYHWLNKTSNPSSGIFKSSLGENDIYLNKVNWCTDVIELDKITCQQKINDYVGLITVSEYLKAGGADSYLNNNSYFYTINGAKDNKVWYVFDEGGINNNSYSNDTYYSFGIRPSIYLKNSVVYYDGDGSIDKPYKIVEDTSKILLFKYPGEYIKYSNYKWRILEQSERFTKLIMDGYILDNNKDNYRTIFSSTNALYKTSSINNYLNNSFYNSLEDKEILQKCDYYIGSYSNYNYKNIYNNKINTYIGIPTINDLFINDYDKYWLASNLSDTKLLVYTATKNGVYADIISNINYIRPIICLDNNLNISSGNGSTNNPYILEVNNESSN